MKTVIVLLNVQNYTSCHYKYAKGQLSSFKMCKKTAIVLLNIKREKNSPQMYKDTAVALSKSSKMGKLKVLCDNCDFF